MNRTYYNSIEQINKVVEFIEKNYSKNHDIQFYANMCNMERKYFITVFKRCTGFSPQRFRTNIRIEEAKKLLLNTDMNNESIANAVGYSDPLYFSRVFKKYTGISPKFFREMGI